MASSKYFKGVSDKLSFPESEEEVLAYWKEIDAFKKSIELSQGKPEYTFYDGPPFATGLPHYGHILAGTIKDTVTRYAHQTGHYVSRRFGWDCHGLPVEYEIDKTLNITDRNQVLEMGVAKYNAECRGIVTRYTSEWEKTVTRLGRWIDFRNDYKTMEPTFMESVWWVFKTLFEKGMVYQGFKVMPFSTACATPLSNFEAGLNYKEVVDVAIIVSFQLESDPEVSLLAWTTTPWTLPSNLALCVNAGFEYVKIKDKKRNRTFILLEKALVKLFPEVGKADCTDERKAELYEIVERFTGDKLVGLKYQPLFPYFATEERVKRAYRVLSDNYVTDDAGVGIVHQAPAFGEDDYRVCLAHGVISKGNDVPCPVDANGKFTQEVTNYAGTYVKAADEQICQDLKTQSKLILKENLVHQYPFCWRSDTPLIYKAVPSWFVAVESIKDQLVENNLKTYWVPAQVQEKRFHNWLVGAKDWAISRNRFWGTPIPLWASDDLEELVAVGSIEELFELSGVRVTDLHKENVDHITIPSKKGKGVLRRVEEVFDCWFESGAMPYAQLHYPFENKDRFDKGFPADFIAEGLDQTRGWFYTLMVLSTALFGQPAFKNLIVNGLVLAADGKKMSKRLKNYTEPEIVINEFGADALRLYLINSPVVRAESLKFQDEGVSEVLRGVLIPWFNAFRFFTQCVERLELNGGKFSPTSGAAYASTNDVDIWILAATSGLVNYVHTEMKAYRLYTVVPRLVSFIDELTNWYVRLNRDRLKGAAGEEEAIVGLNVLYEVMITLTVIMTPFTPFFTEYLYQHLRKLHPLYGNTDSSVPEDTLGKSASVHFLMLPNVDASKLNPLAEARFKTLQEAVELGRAARDKRKIRLSLPVKDVLVVCANSQTLDAINYLKNYFESEVNTWHVTVSDKWQEYCKFKVQPNWKELGKSLGKDMKAVASAIAELTDEQILTFMKEGTMNFCGHNISVDNVVIKREFLGDNNKYEARVSEDGTLLVAVDTTCDEEVLTELRARCISGAVQKLRKAKGLNVQDVVEVFYHESGDDVKAAVARHAASVAKRIRVLPLPATLKPRATYVAKEELNESDLSKDTIILYLTSPAISVDRNTLRSVFGDKTELAAMYLATIEYSRLLGEESVTFTLDGVTGTALRGVHYFATAIDMLKASAELRKQCLLEGVDISSF